MNLEKQQLLALDCLNMGFPKAPLTTAINGPELLLDSSFAILESNNVGTQTGNDTMPARDLRELVLEENNPFPSTNNGCLIQILKILQAR